MTNVEKFKEIFGFDLKSTCKCTSEKCNPNCKKNPNFNITDCPLWLNEEYKKESEDKDIVIQTKNKKNLMLLNIINTAISMCNNKLEYTLEDTISYVKKSLKELEENEEASK